MQDVRDYLGGARDTLETYTGRDSGYLEAGKERYVDAAQSLDDIKNPYLRGYLKGNAVVGTMFAQVGSGLYERLTGGEKGEYSADPPVFEGLDAAGLREDPREFAASWAGAMTLPAATFAQPATLGAVMGAGLLYDMGDGIERTVRSYLEE